MEYISPSLEIINICVEGVLCASGTTEEWDIVDLS